MKSATAAEEGHERSRPGTAAPAARGDSRAAARRTWAAVRPTRLGGKALLFHAVLLTTFFAIPYANLFFLGIAFLSVIALCNVAWAAANLYGVAGRVVELTPQPAGSPFRVRVAVTGTERRTHRAVRALVEVGAGRGQSAALDVDANGATLLVDLPPLPRGVHGPVRVCLESVHPYGLVRARSVVAAPGELVVHPPPCPYDGARGKSLRALEAALVPQGRMAAAEVGTAGLRDWKTGDEVRRVHWRATARRGSMVVREADEADACGLEIVLDRRCAPAALESALSTITSLALLAQERKERLVVQTQGARASCGGVDLASDQSGTDAGSLHGLLRLLAILQTLPADAPAPPPAAAGALRLPVQRRAHDVPAGARP